MPLDVVKPVDNPDFISVLVASRGRPEALGRYLLSVRDTVARPDLIDVWVYRDNDDESESLDLQKLVGPIIKVHVIEGPPLLTQGEICNTLRRACTSNPGIYCPGGDKLRYETFGWDEEVRQAFSYYPDRLALVFLRDQINGKNFASTFLISAEWANALGRIFTEYFPFWYDDTWLNSLAQMIGRFHPLQSTLRVQIGETQRMQNLLFWEQFFNCTFPVRVKESERLRELLIPTRHDDDTALTEAVNTLHAVWRESSQLPPMRKIQLVQLERRQSKRLRTSNPRDAGDSVYRLVERRAAELLRQWAAADRDEESQQRFAKGLRLTSDAAEAHVAEAMEFLKTGDLSAAKQIAGDLLERFPNFPESHEVWARVLSAEHRLEEAESALRGARKLFPLYIGILHLHGAVLFCLNRLGEASLVFDQLAGYVREGTWTQQDGLINLGQFELTRENYHQALEWFQLAVHRDDSDVDAWYGVLAAAQQLGLTSEREKALLRIRRLKGSADTAVGEHSLQGA
ncbi:MAG: tetratricopeptide repeat protein [Candidatus Sericytochromatia bacterium]|nr:tetratricopeptide repeat protein [Candidatus Sericytochromatia bacterium]